MVVDVMIGILVILAGLVMAMAGVKGYLRTSQNKFLAMIVAGLLVVTIPAMCVFGPLYGTVIGAAFTMACSRSAYNKTRTLWLRLVYAFSAMAGLAAALISIGWQLSGYGDSGNLRTSASRQQLWEEVRMRHVGGLLAEHFSSHNTLLVLQPDDPNQRGDPRPGMVTAFQEGLGEYGRVVGYVSPPAETTSYSGLGARPEEIDRLLNSRDDYDMVVFLVDLPLRAMGTMEFWQREDGERPKVILVSGSGNGLRQLLRWKWLDAAVITDFSNPEILKILDPNHELAGNGPSAQTMAEIHTYIDLNNIEEVIKLNPAQYEKIPGLVKRRNK